MFVIDLMGCREGIVCCTVRAPRALNGGLLNLVIRELRPVARRLVQLFIAYVLVEIATLFEDDAVRGQKQERSSSVWIHL